MAESSKERLIAISYGMTCEIEELVNLIEDADLDVKDKTFLLNATNRLYEYIRMLV